MNLSQKEKKKTKKPLTFLKMALATKSLLLILLSSRKAPLLSTSSSLEATSPLFWDLVPLPFYFKAAGTTPPSLEVQRLHKKCCLHRRDLGWLQCEDRTFNQGGESAASEEQMGRSGFPGNNFIRSFCDVGPNRNSSFVVWKSPVQWTQRRRKLSWRSPEAR